MSWRNPSKPEHLDDPRPEPRHLKEEVGTVDGYEVIARRPRVRQFTEPVSPERADRIEDSFGVGRNDEIDPGY